MKRIILLVLSIFTNLLLAQEGIHFENGTFKEILEKARKENKIIFLDAYAVWCGPCKRMEKFVFPKKEVGDFYNTHFINAKIDMEKGEGKDIAKKYNVYSYPTYLFLDSNGELVYRGRGLMSETEFITMGREVYQINKKGDEIKEKFEKGENNIDFLKEAIKLYAKKDYEFAKKVSERYFSLKKKDLSREDFIYLFYFLKSVQDANYKIFVSLKDEIEKEFPKNFYREFNQEIILVDVAKKSVNMENRTFDEVFFRNEATKLLSEEEVEEATNRMKMEFFRSVNDYPQYEKAAMLYYADGSNASKETLLEVAHIFASKSEHKEALEMAVKWLNNNISEEYHYKNLYVLAKLYLKLGNKNLAKTYAEQSFKKAKEANVNTGIVEMLLKEINEE